MPTRAELVPATEKNKLAHAVPLRDRVVIRRDKAVSKTAGGILIPETSQIVQLNGVVVAIGPGKRYEDGTIRPVDGLALGDRVLFTRYAGAPLGDELDTESKLDKYDYTIVGADEIVAVLESSNAKEE